MARGRSAAVLGPCPEPRWTNRTSNGRTVTVTAGAQVTVSNCRRRRPGWESLFLADSEVMPPGTVRVWRDGPVAHTRPACGFNTNG